MGKLHSENVAVVGKIALKKRWFSRRQPAPSRKGTPRAAMEVVHDDGELIPFERYQLSSVGAYLFSEFLHCEGETLTLRLTLPQSEKPLIINSEVVNANMDGDPGMGVVFRDMSGRDKQLLRDYIARKFLKDVR